MKSIAFALHESGKCLPGCVFCDPSPVPEDHDGLSPVGTPAPASVPLGTGASLDHRMAMHTIIMLRKWDEEELAMALTNATLNHDPSAAGAIAAAWMP